ncbi:MAG: hypothetical protein EPO61_00910 [Nitrospirae bacterium]|nr:MAG: hypothetical protein EPO61_00910 [Nitrospirota bacterium]
MCRATSGSTIVAWVGTRLALLLLVGILVVGAILRYSLISYGLPEVYHPDEINLMHETYKFWFSILNLNFSLSTNLFSHLLTLVHAADYLLCRLSGACQAASDFQQMVLLDDPSLLLDGRFLAATFDIGNIYLTYRLGVLLFGTTAGVIAALGYAVTAVPVAAAVWVKMDSVTAFFILLAQIAIIRAMQVRKRAGWYAAGALTGLALGARINAVPLVLALIIGFWWQTRETARSAPSSAAPLDWKVLAGSLGAMVATYLLVSFRLTEAIAHLVGQRRIFWTHPYLEVMVSKALNDWQGNAWLMIARNADFYVAVLLGTVGALGLLVMATALVVTAINGNASARLSFIFPGLYLFPLLLYSTYMSHYVLLLLPFLFCYLGFLLQGMADRIRSVAPQVVGPILAVAVAVILVYPAQVTATYVGYLADTAHQDTRLRAMNWIEANVADGESVAMEKHHELPALVPPIHETPAENREKLLATRDLGLGSGRAREAQLREPHSPSYVIINLTMESPFGERGKPFENAYDTDLLRRQGVRYVVLGEHVPQSYVPKAVGAAFPKKREAFLAWLGMNAELVGDFPPQGDESTVKVVRLLSWFMVDPGVMIYRLEPINGSLVQGGSRDPDRAGSTCGS